MHTYGATNSTAAYKKQLQASTNMQRQPPQVSSPDPSGPTVIDDYDEEEDYEDDDFDEEKARVVPKQPMTKGK